MISGYKITRWHCTNASKRPNSELCPECIARKRAEWNFKNRARMTKQKKANVYHCINLMTRPLETVCDDCKPIRAAMIEVKIMEIGKKNVPNCNRR